MAHLPSWCTTTTALRAITRGSAFTWYTNLLEGFLVSWQTMELKFLWQFYNTQRRVGVAELIKTKLYGLHCEVEGTYFQMPAEVYPTRTSTEWLNSFKHDLLTTLMAQTFEGFNDMHEGLRYGNPLNKHKRSAKKSGKAGCSILAAVAFRERAS